MISNRKDSDLDVKKKGRALIGRAPLFGECEPAITPPALSPCCESTRRH